MLELRDAGERGLELALHPRQLALGDSALVVLGVQRGLVDRVAVAQSGQLRPERQLLLVVGRSSAASDRSASPARCSARRVRSRAAASSARSASTSAALLPGRRRARRPARSRASARGRAPRRARRGRPPRRGWPACASAAPPARPRAPPPCRMSLTLAASAASSAASRRSRPAARSAASAGRPRARRGRRPAPRRSRRARGRGPGAARALRVRLALAVTRSEGLRGRGASRCRARYAPPRAPRPCGRARRQRRPRRARRRAGPARRPAHGPRRRASARRACSRAAAVSAAACSSACSAASSRFAIASARARSSPRLASATASAARRSSARRARRCCSPSCPRSSLTLASARAWAWGPRARRRRRPPARRPRGGGASATAGLAAARFGDRQRRHLGGRRLQRLQPPLQLGGAQFEHLDGLERLRGSLRLRPLGRLGPPRPALREHGAVDDLAARLGRRLGNRRRRRLETARGRRQRDARAAPPAEPERVRGRLHQRRRHEVGRAPHGRVAAEARVGQRLEAALLGAAPHAQRGEVGLAAVQVGPAPAHAHEPGVRARRQPLDRVEREPCEQRDGRGGIHPPDALRPRGGGYAREPARCGEPAATRGPQRVTRRRRA